MHEHALGRLYAPDARDGNFPVAPRLAVAPPTRTYRAWSDNGWWGDQGAKPECVVYAFDHLLADAPVTHTPKPRIVPDEFYAACQAIDPWAGTPHDGTDPHAACKVLQDRGLISEYRWATDVATIVQALLTTGPVAMGTNWYTSMFTPDAQGFVTISGIVEGGHEWVINGINTKTGVARAKNSWGRHWGKSGHFYLRLDTLGRLLSEQGDACVVFEV
jgi:hypothetical protein